MSAGSGNGGTHGGIVHSIGDGSAVGVAGLEEGGQGHAAVRHNDVGGDVGADVLCTKSVVIAVSAHNPASEVVAIVGDGLEAHGVASDVLVSAGSGDGGTHGGVLDSEGHSQSVGHGHGSSADAKGDVVDEQVVVVIAVVVVYGDVNALAGIGVEVHNVVDPIVSAVGVDGKESGGEGGGVVGGGGDHHIVEFGGII